MTPSTGGQSWKLDTLGNWVDQRDDLAPVAGVFNDAGDTLDSRTHDQANQLTQRVIKNGSGTTVLATLPLSYDPAGNMRQELFRDELSGINRARRYTHDAWGRLVKVERATNEAATTWADLGRISRKMQFKSCCPDLPGGTSPVRPGVCGSGARRQWQASQGLFHQRSDANQPQACWRWESTEVLGVLHCPAAADTLHSRHPSWFVHWYFRWRI